MTIKVVDILGRASVILQDTAATRFTNANLLKFFNDGQREVVLHRPDAHVANGTHACVNGSKQTIPAGGHRLINVHRNTNGHGMTQQRVLTALSTLSMIRLIQRIFMSTLKQFPAHIRLRLFIALYLVISVLVISPLILLLWE